MMMLLSFSSCFSQYWERSLGGPDTFEYIYDMDESYDKGIILGTRLVDEISPNYQQYTQSAIIYKTDINGNTLWYRNLRIDQCGLVGCKDIGDGTTVSLLVLRISDYKNKMILTRIDPCGNVLWCKEIIDGFDCGCQSYDIEVINNKIVFWREYMCDDLDYKYDILMFDLNGEMLCKKPFLHKSEHPFMNSPFINRVLPLPNNEFMLLGRVYYKANPNSPAFLRAMFIKFDAKGNEQWVLPFGLDDEIISFSSNCENVVTTSDGRYFAFSCIYTLPLELLLMKFNDSGIENGFVISEIDTLFNIGYYPFFAGAEMISDNKFLTQIGYQLPDNPNHVGYCEATVDSTISSIIDTLHLNGYHLYPKAMRKTHDGKYLMGGYDRSYDDLQAYLNKVSLDPLSFDTMYNAPYNYDTLCTENIIYADTIYFDDCLPVGNNIFDNGNSTKYPIHFYPNPAQEELSISFGAKAYTTPITITIHTLTGEIKWQGALALGEQTKRLSVYSWPKGIYIVTARKGNEVVGREKVVVM